jgi:hypothetical protein
VQVFQLEKEESTRIDTWEQEILVKIGEAKALEKKRQSELQKLQDTISVITAEVQHHFMKPLLFNMQVC